MNKMIENINVSSDVKKYINNYINESIKLMNERGYIDELIWLHDWCDNLHIDIITLLENDIITYGVYNEDSILVPHNNIDDTDINILYYMLSDRVLLENGFYYPKS